MQFWKKFAALLTTGALLSASLPLAAAAEEETEKVYEHLEYRELNNGTIQITGVSIDWTVSDEDREIISSIEIPAQIDGKPVTRIDQFAFDYTYNEDLTSITIPDSVTIIAAGAFQGCSSLKEITIPDGVTRISPWLFNGCTALEEIHLPEQLKDIGNSTFRGTAWLERQERTDGMVIFHNTVIDASQTSGDVVIPDGVTKICEYTFCDVDPETSQLLDSPITSLTIPASVQTIGMLGMEYCKSLESFTVSPENPKYKSVDGVLFSKDGTQLLSCPKQKSGAYTIPEGVTDLRKNGNFDGAFRNCTKLTAVTVPASVTKLEPMTFLGCTSLTQVTLSEGLTEIGPSAFSQCTSLAEISIPDSVSHIGGNAFYNTALLTEQTSPAKYADKWLIDFDSTVSELEIQPGTVGIAAGGLPYCYVDEEEGDTKYLRKLTIPDSLQYISEEFDTYDDSGATFERIDFSHLEEISMSDALREKYLYWFLDSPWAEAQKETLENGMIVIGDVLVDATMCEGTVVVPDGIRVIAGGAFDTYLPNPEDESELYRIQEVVLPDSVTRIENGAFVWCLGLKSFRIPPHLEYMGNIFGYPNAGAYEILENLEMRVEFPDTLTAFGEFACIGFDSVTLPDSMKELPKGGAWGSGHTTNPLQGVSEVVLPSQLEVISEISFGYGAVQTLTIPNTVKRIDWAAFAGCNDLQEIYFEGTEEEWNAIDIAWNGYWFLHNGKLTAAELHFQDSPEEPAESTSTALQTTTADPETTTETTTVTAADLSAEADQPSQTTGEAGTIPAGICGDVNMDGRVDITDAVLLNKAAAQMVKLSEQAVQNGDCNTDGEVGSTDALILLRFLVHLIDTLPYIG